MGDSGPHGWTAPPSNTRQEAVERPVAEVFAHAYGKKVTPFMLQAARGAIAASGLLDANNQLRQRLAEAENERNWALECQEDSSNAATDLAQRLTEAEGLLARTAENLMALHNATQEQVQGAWDELWACREAVDAYRTKYTPEPPE